MQKRRVVPLEDDLYQSSILSLLYGVQLFFLHFQGFFQGFDNPPEYDLNPK